MVSRTSARSAGASSIEFEERLGPMVVFLVVPTLLFVAVPAFVYPRIETPLFTLAVMTAAFAATAAIAWAVLRWEGLRAADVGLGREDVLPGLLPVVGLYVLLNVGAAASLLLTGGSVTLAPGAGPSFAVWALVTGVYFVAGLSEEFAYRAYLQNKLVALLGGGTDRVRRAVAILFGGVLFTLAHVPQRVVEMGLGSPGAIAGTFVSVVVLGLLLGVLYEYTRNVVFVGSLHGSFNWSAFVVEGAPANDLMLFVGLPALVVLAWSYRRWATGTRPRIFGPQRQLAATR
jgi:membrane protease YdiL (CAAX protease family)